MLSANICHYVKTALFSLPHHQIVTTIANVTAILHNGLNVTTTPTGDTNAM